MVIEFRNTTLDIKYVHGMQFSLDLKRCPDKFKLTTPVRVIEDICSTYMIKHEFISTKHPFNVATSALKFERIFKTDLKSTNCVICS